MMKTVLKRLAMLGLCGFVLSLPLAAHADTDEDGDHDRARDLYERGEIKGLSNILRVVHAAAPGDIVDGPLTTLVWAAACRSPGRKMPSSQAGEVLTCGWR